MNFFTLLAILLGFSFCSLLIDNGPVVVQALHKIYPELQSLENDNDTIEIKQPHRTGFHFQPHRHWMNDPNGPMYFKGIYHLFYQYNPEGAVWGNIVWAHSISRDLINWKSLKPALSPSKPFDINGCWSGSATVLPGFKPVILYTGIDSQNRQVQNYAIPANLFDPHLTEWVKPDNNPIVDPGTEVNSSAFRDPSTAWLSFNGHWNTIIGSRSEQTGMAYLYRSKDFLNWTKVEQPLHSVPNTGMWECPDFYPVSHFGRFGVDTSVTGNWVKHVLKVSLEMTGYEYYTVGKYYPMTDKYVPDNTSADGWSGLRYDYGNFYASKSFYDPMKKRRVLWGWANESDSVQDDVSKGWAGIQAIPRTVWLDPNGKQLLQWPVMELNRLRRKRVMMIHQKLVKGQNVEIKGITAAQADVEVIFSLSSLDNAEAFDPSWVDAQAVCSQLGSTAQGGVGPFGLLTLASENLEEFTPVFFRIFKGETNETNHVVLMCSDARSSSLKDGLYKPTFAGFVDIDLSSKKLPLRSLIDHSVIESFGGGGKTCITSRVYPTKAVFENAHLHVFNNGTESITVEYLSAWSMRSAWVN